MPPHTLTPHTISPSHSHPEVLPLMRDSIDELLLSLDLRQDPTLLWPALHTLSSAVARWSQAEGKVGVAYELCNPKWQIWLNCIGIDFHMVGVAWRCMWPGQVDDWVWPG